MQRAPIDKQTHGHFATVGPRYSLAEVSSEGTPPLKAVEPHISLQRQPESQREGC